MPAAVQIKLKIERVCAVGQVRKRYSPSSVGRIISPGDRRGTYRSKAREVVVADEPADSAVGARKRKQSCRLQFPHSINSVQSDHVTRPQRAARSKNSRPLRIGTPSQTAQIRISSLH